MGPRFGVFARDGREAEVFGSRKRCGMRCVHHLRILYAGTPWTWMRDVDFASPLYSWESLA